VTCALDGRADRPLALGATPDLAAAFNLAMLVQETLQRRDVLVVHHQRLAVADVTTATATATFTAAVIAIITIASVAPITSVAAVPSVTAIAAVSSIKSHLVLLAQRR
jgi:hypothetical protein